MLDKYRDSVFVAVGALFEIAGLWQFNLPVGEALVSEAIAVIFLILGALIGGPAVIRRARGKKLVDKSTINQ